MNKNTKSNSINFYKYFAKVIRLVVYLPLFFTFIATAQDSSHIEYIPNQGQWHSNAIYRANIRAGVLFLENRTLTYNLLSPHDIEHSHAHHGDNHTYKYYNKVHGHAFKVKFKRANKKPQIIPLHKTADYCNYFIGNNPNKWASNVSKYKALKYLDFYKGIDFKVYSQGVNVKYDFIIHQNGKPNKIKFEYSGIDSLSINKEGCLVVKTSVNELVEQKPYAYQIIEGIKKEVPCVYKLRRNTVSFDLPEGYNTKYDLIIDPTLIFSTYTGSTMDNWGFTAAFDDDGNVFSGGMAFYSASGSYPVSVGAYQETFAGANSQWGNDIAIIKYSADGSNRIFATYLGGSGSEMPHSLFANEFGELLVFGTTGSANFPMSVNAYDNTFNGGSAVTYDNVINFPNGVDIYVSKLSADGTQLLASTYVGGSENDGFNFRQSYADSIMHGSKNWLYYNYGDGARGELITDDQNNVYIGSTTFSSDFPVTANAYQNVYLGQQEGVVFKLDDNLSNMIFGSYIGGTDDDAVYSIDTDSDYNLYITGGTKSPFMPVTSNAYDNTYNGSIDGFVAQISYNGSTLMNGTYFGSAEYDQSYFVRLDDEDNVYIYGQTMAPDNTLIYNATYNTPNSGQFIAKFNSTLSSLEWSTVFGTGNGKPNISPTAFAVDICNRMYLSGWGREWANHDGYSWQSIEGTKNMDITPGAYQSNTDGQDFYIMVLSDDASTLSYSTYFGEVNYPSCGYSGHDHVDGGTSRFDKKGNIYQSICASCGGCQQFPTGPGNVWSPVNSSTNCNNAVFKFNVYYDYALADFDLPGIVCAPANIDFENNSTGTDFIWDFGDGSPQSTINEPSHSYTQPGTYYVTLIAIDSSSCNVADTVIKPLQVLSNTVDTLPKKTICYGDGIQIGLVPNPDTSITYHWSPDIYLTDNSIANPFAAPDSTIQYILQVSNGVCTDTLYQTVSVLNLSINPYSSIICLSDTAEFIANINEPAFVQAFIWSSNSSFTDTLTGIANNTISVSPQNDQMYYLKVITQYCSLLDSFYVSVDKFDLQLDSVSQIVCHDDCNGSIGLSAHDGILPYDFSWNSGHTGQIITDLCADTYTVEATDSLGCTKLDTVVLTNPPQLTAIIWDTTHVECNGICNGSATISVSGGTAPYTHSWSNGDNGSMVQGLCAGTIYDTITDANGCQVILPVEIHDPSDLLLAVADAHDASCYGYCDGSMLVLASGGTPNYTYTWSSGQSSQLADGLCADTYSVMVTDANNCSRTIYVTVDEPDSLIVSTQVVQELLCNDACTAQADATCSGGTPPYDYSWDDSQFQQTQTASALCPGTYTVSVVDSNGCNAISPVTIDNPLPILITALITDTPCDGVCEGIIEASISNGTPPFLFSWDNGSSSNINEHLCPDIYNLQVTDSNNCTAQQSFVVGVSNYIPPLDVSADDDVVYLGESTTLHATENQGYTYDWSPQESIDDPTLANPDATPTTTTTYVVTVTDSIGCTNTDSITLLVDDNYCGEPYIYVPNAFTPNGDNENDFIMVHGHGITELYFAIYNRWGEKVFETTDQNDKWYGTYKGKDSDAGVFDYYLQIKCGNNEDFFKKGNITLIR